MCSLRSASLEYQLFSSLFRRRSRWILNSFVSREAFLDSFLRIECRKYPFDIVERRRAKTCLGRIGDRLFQLKTQFQSGIEFELGQLPLFRGLDFETPHPGLSFNESFERQIQGQR